MTTAEFVSVVSTLVSIVVGGLLGVTVLALVDRYCRGMGRLEPSRSSARRSRSPAAPADRGLGRRRGGGPTSRRRRFPPLRLRALERGLQAMHDDAGAPLGHQSRVRGDFARAEAR